MIIGDTRKFAMEFDILTAYPDDHFLALGLLVYHIGGKEYGIRTADATTFGNAVDSAQTLLRRPRDAEPSELAQMPSFDLADLYLDAVYREHPKGFPESERERRYQLFLSPDCLWPSSDEEFDDGSHVFVFDKDNHVRLIGFKNDDHNVASLVETLIERSEFDKVLSDWLAAFESQRQSALQSN